METKRIEQYLRKHGIKSNMYAFGRILESRKKREFKILLRCRCSQCLRTNVARRLAFANAGVKLGYSDLDPHKYDYLENE